MIFLCTGEEKFLLDQQLKKWKDAFVKKYGSNNLYIFQEDNFDPEQIASALAGGGLFEEKKFIIIK
jgi:DNA polymerase III delta subunit